MMLCKKASSLLTAAEEGALSGADKFWFDCHLTVCGPCRRYRRQMQATAEALRKLPKEEPSSSLVDALSEALKKDV